MISKKSAITIGASVIALAFSAPAFAQNSEASNADAEANSGDVITVTGIRAAIVQGLENKRASNAVVESIAAEDIGKMPDSNLAEVLQRVPGVSIDRDGGEGRYVSIRGLGPTFNTVLINGRHIATSEGDRSFGFDTISSDLVGGMNVYKTQEAFLREGGVGGTIDVRTMHPLDHNGLHLTARAEGNYERNSRKVTPNGSVLLSDTFLDNRLGILLNASYQRRENRTYNISTDKGNGGLRTENAFTLPGWGPPAPDVHYWNYGNFGVGPAMIQQELDRNVMNEKRERIGLYGDIQFRPNDAMEFNVDYLYSRFKVETDQVQVGNWFWELMPPASATSWIRANIVDSNPSSPGYNGTAQGWNDLLNLISTTSKTAVDSNGVVTKATAYPGLASQAFNGLLIQRPTDTHMVGLNYTWDISSALKLTVDGAYSTAKLNNPGRNLRRSLENLGTGSFTYVNDGGTPYLTGLAPGLSATSSMPRDPNAPTSIGYRLQYNYGQVVKSTNKEASFNFDYDASPNLSLRFGGLFEEASKTSEDWKTPDSQGRTFQNKQTAPLLGSQLAALTNGLITSPASAYGVPSNADTASFLLNFPAFTTYAMDPSHLNTTYLTATQAQIDAFKAYAAAHGGDPWAATLTGAGYRVRERSSAAYVSATYTADRLTIIGGLRFVHTNTLAEGNSQVVSSISVVSGAGGAPTAQINYQNGGALLGVSQTRSYNNVLPNLMVKFDLADDIVLRFGASRSLTRPNLDILAPVITSITAGLSGGSIAMNNPGLKPLVSTNIDLAGEWYFAQGSALTFDAFWKNLDGVITTQTQPGSISLPGVNQTATLNGATYNVNNFVLTTPANAKSAEIWGATVGVTHGFNNGLGFQVNYTVTGTNRKFDPKTYNPSEVALPGLSDNFNATAYYEHGIVSARIAYNWRSKFLSNPAFPGGMYGSSLEPVFTKARGQLDARLAFNISKAFQVYAEGTNLTNAAEVQVGRFDNLFVARSNYGSRFNFGISARY